jgi:DNA-binding ferritin-like protein
MDTALLKHQAHNDLPSNAKAVSIAVLNARLADAIDLALLTKQAHWNIKGPNFIALHEMIDGFRTELDSHVDMMAERVAQLGGTALGTTRSVAAATTCTPYPTDICKTKDHLAALIERQSWKFATRSGRRDRRGRRLRHQRSADRVFARPRQAVVVPRGAVQERE